MINLQSVIPDFVGVNNFQEIQSRFVKSARSIIFSHELVHRDNGSHWRITALELYLCTAAASNVWQDPYTHGNPAQFEWGTWYVHDDGHRAPFYSGIDITCGSKKAGIYGGLLVRALDHERRWVFQKIVRGPALNKQRKGNRWNAHEQDIIEQQIHSKRVDDPLGLLQLKGLKATQARAENNRLWIGPRIGLKKKSHFSVGNPEGVAFRTAPLRAATWQMDTTMTESTA